MTRSIYFVAAGALLAAVVAGCSKPADSPTQPTPPLSVPKDEAREHGHKKSELGGLIFHVGQDNYHVEAIFEKGGTLRLYTRGADETKPFAVEARELTAFARAQGDAEATSFTLKPAPLPDDARGQTTQFVGQLPKDVQGKKVDVTIPNMRFGGETFRVGVRNYENQKHAEPTMPVKVTGEKERVLYLTPGGKYTEADIKANGGLTARQKFDGIEAEHDTDPKPGDKICPVTSTKANEKFAWIVGGKKYEFCCPPCVDDFLKKAKSSPESIKDPDEYRQK